MALISIFVQFNFKIFDSTYDFKAISAGGKAEKLVR